MTNDRIAITFAAFAFCCWLVLWLRSMRSPSAPLAEPEQGERDYVLRWDAGGIERGDWGKE